MKYNRFFNPNLVQTFPSADRATIPSVADRRDGSVYVYTEEIVLAVNVALATQRPLLLRGPSGSGKSSLAQSVARVLDWRYYEEVITSRTQARDLLWTFDTLRRLNDATIRDRDLKPDAAYIAPGVLWWAFDPGSASRRGAKLNTAKLEPLTDAGKGPADAAAVVLLDEIDKADPDVPNNLLVPIGSLQFSVQEVGGEEILVKAQKPPLIFITTNNERELPTAFLRRCIVLELQSPDKSRLVQIAEAQLGDKHTKFYEVVADMLVRDRQGAAEAATTEPPSTAEYLDALRTCLSLKIQRAQMETSHAE